MSAITTTTSGNGPGPDERPRTLTDAGGNTWVRDPSRRWQRVMDAVISCEIEELSASPLIGLMTDSRIDPDLAVEVSALESATTSGGR